MAWIFAVIGLVIIVVIGLVVLGRETARLAASPKPAVLELADAVEWIADHLPGDTQARISYDDVHWILFADADLFEDPDDPDDPLVVDETDAVARVLERADASGRDLRDEDVVAVLDARTSYLEAIGAVGPAVD